MSRWKGICIIWSYGGKRNDAPATGVWTAIGFAVGLVLGREVEAAPFFLNAGFFWLVWGLIALFCAWVAFLARGLPPNWADSKNEGLVLCEAQSPSTDGADEFLARIDPPGGDADSRAGDTWGSRRERPSHS